MLRTLSVSSIAGFADDPATNDWKPESWKRNLLLPGQRFVPALAILQYMLQSPPMVGVAKTSRLAAGIEGGWNGTVTGSDQLNSCPSVYSHHAVEMQHTPEKTNRKRLCASRREPRILRDASLVGRVAGKTDFASTQ